MQSWIFELILQNNFLQWCMYGYIFLYLFINMLLFSHTIIVIYTFNTSLISCIIRRHCGDIWFTMAILCFLFFYYFTWSLKLSSQLWSYFNSTEASHLPTGCVCSSNQSIKSEVNSLHLISDFSPSERSLIRCRELNLFFIHIKSCSK